MWGGGRRSVSSVTSWYCWNEYVPVAMVAVSHYLHLLFAARLAHAHAATSLLQRRPVFCILALPCTNRHLASSSYACLPLHHLP